MFEAPEVAVEENNYNVTLDVKDETETGQADLSGFKILAMNYFGDMTLSFTQNMIAVDDLSLIN